MRVSDLEHLYDYHYWANGKLLAVVSQLTPAQFTQPVAGSYGSVRSTLVHVLSAEWGWLDRCGGPARGDRLKPEDYPTFDSLVQVWSRVEGFVRAFLAGLHDGDLAREVRFAIGGGPQHAVPLGDLMRHSVVHATHHRGQVALLLRQLGFVPGNFDWLIYVEEETAARATAAGAEPEGSGALDATSLSPSLTVKDLQASLAWYRDVVGFAVDRLYERDGRLRAAALKAGTVRFLINQDDGAKGWDRVKGEGFSLRITTTQSIDAIASGIRQRGGTLDSEPADTPWGARIFRLRDPDGYKLTISSVT